MRRMWAAGAVIVVCLAFGGVTAVAQEASPAGTEWAAAAASSDCRLKTAGISQSASEPYGLTGQVLACTETASDPRVTGTSTVVLNVEGWDPRQAYNYVTWTDYTLQGPEGTWSGHGYGLYDSEGVAHLVIIATGSEAYEGLTYAQSVTIPAGTAHVDSIGLIQPGSPPPGFPVALFLEPAAE